MLASAGIPNEQIAQKLNISVEMVEALMENWL
jgi:DNA-binding CsgD family transcriptional regulator